MLELNANKARIGLNKENLLGSVFGEGLKTCVDDIELWLRLLNRARMRHNKDLEKEMRRLLQLDVRQLNAYRLALHEFYNMNYVLRRTDTYYGLVNPNDETDWLFKELFKQESPDKVWRGIRF